MKLKNIKENKDNYLTKYVLHEIKLIKKHFKLPKNSKIYYLGYYNSREYFLYNNFVFVVAWVETLEETLKEFYAINLLKDFPQSENDIEFTVIIDKIKNQDSKIYQPYTAKDFLIWINQPCNLTDNVDVPYYKVIKFLKDYKTSDFKQENFNFYIKKSKDWSMTLNIYVKNLKNNQNAKLYFPDKWVDDSENGWQKIAPCNTKDIVLEDLSKNINSYQKTKIKKSYLEFSKIFNEKLQSTNHYVLELLKQAILPIELHCGIGFCPVFDNIRVEDFPCINEEPCFFITNTPFLDTTTKIACLNFKSATYHTKGIYKYGNYKRNFWNLDKEYIEKLVVFFNEPINNEVYHFKTKSYEKYVRTNWQHLIYSYNRNLIDWDWDSDTLPPIGKTEDGIEFVPFDLPIPDYTKLLQNAY